jgi:hypothetical protein
VVRVEAEAPNLHGFAATLVLSRADARVERVEELVVPQEQALPVDRVVAPLDARVNRRRNDDDRLVDGWDDERDRNPQALGRLAGALGGRLVRDGDAMLRAELPCR